MCDYTKQTHTRTAFADAGAREYDRKAATLAIDTVRNNE